MIVPSTATLTLAAIFGLFGADKSPAVSPPFERLADTAEAPLGGQTIIAFDNYVRVAPNAAVAGKPGPSGLETVRAAEFGLVLDLRGPDEDGVADDAKGAAALGVERVLLTFPGADERDLTPFMTEFSALLEDRSNYPILIHCGSGNRAAAAWALYRAKRGVPAIVAVEEGRAAGLTGREAMVRAILGLPAE